MRKLLTAFLLPLFLVSKASAHCPLCTAGAGVAAGFASYLGIDFAVIGVLIGGFSWALGSWTAKWVRSRYGDKIRRQNFIVSSIIFLSIIVPGYMTMPEATPMTIWFIGEYGTTVAFNNFLIGAVTGGLIVYSTPALSKKISRIRGETLPYQGMTLTLTLLILAAVIMQLVM